MVRNISYILLFLAIIVYLYHTLFFGIFETTDSFFYWGFGNYIRTGFYNAPYPYNYRIPSTMEPPLYGILLYLADTFGRADIIIHLFQILCLFISGWFLYRILIPAIGRDKSRLVYMLYLFIPGNILQVSSVMSEMLAVLLFSLFLYLLFQIISGKRVKLAGWLVVLSPIMVLSRYNFIVYFGLSVLLFFIFRYKRLKHYPFLVIGFFILMSWIFINHQLHGNWGLSSSEGKHLYNRVVSGDYLLPPSDHTALKTLRHYVGDADLYRPWWFIEPLIIDKVDFREAEVSRILKDVAVAAILHNPAVYLTHAMNNFFVLHSDGLPVPDKLYTYGPWMGKGCRTLGNIHFCTPILETNTALMFWNWIVDITEFYYHHLPRYTNIIFYALSLVVIFLSRDRFARICVLIYFLGTIIPVMVEVPVSRYIFPLYIPKIIISVEAIRIIAKTYSRLISKGLIIRKA